MEFENVTTYANYRSRLNQIPLDVKVEISKIAYQIGMLPTSRKNKIIEILKENKIDFSEVGTGTNRFIVKYDGYALKIALDQEGIADNKQEIAICKMLGPDAALAYEISTNGNLLIAEYCPAFTTYSEMNSWRTEISKILQKWGTRFLLGDVGINRVNFGNWGIGPDGRPKCIDYAYLFPMGMNLFKCICGSNQLEFADSSFSSYKCQICGKQYEDREIRMRISQETRLKLFNSFDGVRMSEAVESHVVDPKYIKEEYNPDRPNPYETYAGLLGLDICGNHQKFFDDNPRRLDNALFENIK